MPKIISGAFDGYTGNCQYRVEHPQLGVAIVTAPDEDTAVVAAAKAFGVSWRKVSFYSYCIVTKI